jgi:hypothetical protein
MKEFIKELWQRLLAESPSFFKKLMGVFISLGATATGLLLAKEYLPKWLDEEILKTIIAGSAFAVFVCKLPVNWNNTSPNDVPAVPAPTAVDLMKELTDQPKDNVEQS